MPTGGVDGNGGLSPAHPVRDLFRHLKSSKLGIVGVVMTTGLILTALVGPSLPYVKNQPAQDLRNRLKPPLLWGGTWDHPLGTDQLGRDMLARLSVFPNDASLEAATEVTSGDLNTLEGLVTNSMVQRVSAVDHPRFQMLETVPEQGRWLDVLDEEQDNIRAALDHAHLSDDAETEVRLVVALWRFWWLRGYLVEGRARLEEAIARGAGVAPRLRADAYRAGAGIAWTQGDLVRARELATLGLEAAEHSGEGAIALACHTVLGLIAKAEGDYDRARSHLEQSGEMASALGREGDELVAKMNLGSVAFDSGDHAAAVPLWTDVLAYHRTSGTPEGQGLALLNLGLAAFRLGKITEARTRFTEAEGLFSAIGFREPLAHAFQGLAATAAAEGRDREAASLLGQAAALLEETGSGDGTFDASLAQETEADLRARLGDQAFSSAFAPRAQHSGDQP